MFYKETTKALTTSHCHRNDLFASKKIVSKLFFFFRLKFHVGGKWIYCWVLYASKECVQYTIVSCVVHIKIYFKNKKKCSASIGQFSWFFCSGQKKTENQTDAIFSRCFHFENSNDTYQNPFLEIYSKIQTNRWRLLKRNQQKQKKNLFHAFRSRNIDDTKKNRSFF